MVYGLNEERMQKICQTKKNENIIFLHLGRKSEESKEKIVNI